MQRKEKEEKKTERFYPLQQLVFLNEFDLDINYRLEHKVKMMSGINLSLLFSTGDSRFSEPLNSEYLRFSELFAVDQNFTT